LEGRGRQISEFEASLVYKVSSRTARAIQRNPVSKNHKNKTKQNKNKNKNKKTEKKTCLFICVCIFMNLWCLKGPEESNRFSRTGVNDNL
jgi:CRISPR/Cas system CSM-associated protein Csm4 (group 5 of RAMP superfamily)